MSSTIRKYCDKNEFFKVRVSVNKIFIININIINMKYINILKRDVRIVRSARRA